MGNLDDLFTTAQVFRKLSPLEQRELHSTAIYKTYNKGDVITLNGYMWPYVIIIENGLIYAQKDSDGKSLTVRSFTNGDVFWGHALFGNYVTPTTLYAFVDSTIYQWTSNDILPIILNNNEALWDLCLQLNQRLIEASKQIEEIAFSPVVNRLAKLLLEQFNSSENQSLIDRKMTLDEMAAKIGTTREVVCRLLYRFSDRNLIQVDRTKFILVNKIDLSKLAEGEMII